MVYVELVMVFVLCVLVLSLVSNRIAINRKNSILKNKKNAIVLFEYIRGIESFQTGKGAFLELLPDRVTIKQPHTSSFSILFSQIQEVKEEKSQRITNSLEYNSIQDDYSYINKTLLSSYFLIIYLNENNTTHEILFRQTGGIKYSTFFTKLFQEKIQSNVTQKNNSN